MPAIEHEPEAQVGQKGALNNTPQLPPTRRPYRASMISQRASTRGEAMNRTGASNSRDAAVAVMGATPGEILDRMIERAAVSYTHLTLPTILLV